MSSNRSVGRSTATHIDDRSPAAQEKDRFASTQENHHSAAKAKVGRFTTTSKKDRSGLCAFTFADGRQCRTPRRSGHPHLCYFHAQKEAQARAAKQAGEAISSFFFSDYLSACDLSAALGRVFSAVAEGHLKPKVATALAYLGQTLNQSVRLAQNEYANVFGGDVWRRRVAACLEPPPRPPQPVSKPAPSQQPAPALASPPASKPCTSDMSPCGVVAALSHLASTATPVGAARLLSGSPAHSSVSDYSVYRDLKSASRGNLRLCMGYFPDYFNVEHSK